MAGTFGQQLQSQKQTGRLTRTQRILQNKEKLRQNERFAQLKNEAERIKEERFSKTATIEEYTTEYNKLSPELKQFFASPQELTVQREKRIAEGKTNVNQVLEKWQKEIDEKRAYIEQLKQRWNERPNSYRSDPNNRKRFNEDIKSYEQDITQSQNQIYYLQSSVGKIEQGYNWTDLVDYAEQKASAVRNRKENTVKLNEQLKNNPDLVGIYDVNKRVVGVWDTKKNPLPDYLKKAGLSVPNISYYNSIVNWSKKAGYNSLPSWAKQKVLNPSAYEWQEQNRGERLNFNEKGEVVSIRSEKYKETLPVDAYKSRPVMEFEKANPDEVLLKNNAGEVYAVQSKQFGGTFTIEEYNNKVDEYNKSIKTPEQMVAEFKEEDKNKPMFVDLEKVDTSKQGYVQRGTVGANTNQFTKISSDTEVVKKDSKIMSSVKKAIDWIYNKSGDINFKTPSPAFAVNKDESQVKIRDLTDNLKEVNTKAIENFYINDIEKSGIKAELDAKYQQEYQSRFERAYMEDIILGKIDFETAKEKFSNSEDAKLINKKYQIEVEKKRAEKGLTWNSAKIVGLQVVGSGIKLVPETYGELGFETALVYTGYKTLTYIPPSVLNVATFGIGTKGTMNAFNKSLSPERRIQGILTATLSFGTLGYQAYRWLRSPKITYSYPKLKRPNVKSSATIGRDIKASEDGISKVVYGNQKLEQFSQAGRRTLVTTKGRFYSNRLFGTKFERIYEGIPTQQKAVYGTDTLRGTKYLIKQSGYQSALKKLMQYGYTRPQAVRTLRFYSPVYQEQWLTKGVLAIKDNSAIGKFFYELRKPKIVVDEKLGIYTKGGKTMRDTIGVQRKIVEFNNEEMMLELKGRISQYLSKSGKVFANKGVGISVSLTKAKATELKKGSEYVGKINDVDIFRDAMYKDIYSISREGKSMSAVFSRKSGVDIERIKMFNARRTTLFDYENNLKESYGKVILQKGKTSPVKSIKTPQLDTNIKNFQSQSPNIIAEKTRTTTTQVLKSDVTPVSRVKNQIKKMSIITKSSVIPALGLSLSSASTQVMKMGLKTNLKTNLTFKEALQQSTLQKVEVAQKQTPQQKVALRVGIRNLTITPTVTINPFRSPIRLPPRPPKINVKPFAFNDNDYLKLKIKQKKRTNLKNIYALLPDFTSKAFGLKPKVFKLKDSLKAVRKIQTGFELRTGGRIDERNLMNSVAN